MTRVVYPMLGIMLDNIITMRWCKYSSAISKHPLSKAVPDGYMSG